MSQPSQESYRADLESALQRLREGTAKVIIPAQQNLNQARPGFLFHPSPEVFIQTGGATDFACGDQEFRLYAGEFCIMPRGVPHKETPIDLATPYRILVSTRDKNGCFLQRARSDEKRRILDYATLHLHGARGREAFRYLDDAANLDGIPTPHQKEFVQSLLTAFFLTILARLRALKRDGKLASASTLIGEVERHVGMGLGDHELSVASLAGLLGCTPDHLSRQFRRERGVTLINWITSERISMAKELLSDNRYNIGEVAWACGFKEPSYFIRTFRLHTGMTPRTFRSRQAEKKTGFSN